MTDNKEQRTPEELVVSGLRSGSIEFTIDSDGDLLIERYEDSIYVPAGELTKLRDWLNKVLP